MHGLTSVHGAMDSVTKPSPNHGVTASNADERKASLMAVTRIKTVYFETLPKCNFCGLDAHVDAPTSRGPWAYQCTVCWPLVGNPAGMHTLLVQGDEPEMDPATKRAEIMAAVEAGDFDAAEDLIGDGDFAEWL